MSISQGYFFISILCTRLRDKRLRSLVVEHLLRKQKVVGSIPIVGLAFDFSVSTAVILPYVVRRFSDVVLQKGCAVKSQIISPNHSF